MYQDDRAHTIAQSFCLSVLFFCHSTKRVQTASGKRNYSGVLVMTQGDLPLARA